MTRQTLLLAIAVAGATLVGRAHHSIAGVYDTSRQVAVEGVVSAFRFVNPHPFLLMDATDALQNTQSWRLEVDNRWELAAIGITAETWNPGDRIVVTGFPGRTQPQSLYVRTLQRPADGLLYEQFGSNPRIRPARRRSGPGVGLCRSIEPDQRPPGAKDERDLATRSSQAIARC